MNSGTFSQASHTLRIIEDKKPELRHIKLLHEGYLSALVAGITEGTQPDLETFCVMMGMLPPKAKIVVDYDLGFEKMVELCNFAKVSRQMKSIQITGSGKQTLYPQLIMGWGDHEEAAKHAREKGLRFGKVEELLALAARFPNLQYKFPIMALGSGGFGEEKYKEFPTLWGLDDRNFGGSYVNCALPGGARLLVFET